MCRVNVPYRPPRPRLAVSEADYEQLQSGLYAVKEDVSGSDPNFEGLFEDGTVDFGPGPDLLEVFKCGISTSADPLAAEGVSRDVHLGSALEPAFGVHVLPNAPENRAEVMSTQQQQQQQQHLQALLMQQQAAMLAPTLSASQQQGYSQVVLPPRQALSYAKPAHHPAVPSKRHKTAEEIAAQQERVKRRRRESAARSRERKSCYVMALEAENAALKAENAALKGRLLCASGGSGAGADPAIQSHGSSAGLDFLHGGCDASAPRLGSPAEWQTASGGSPEALSQLHCDALYPADLSRLPSLDLPM